MSLFDLPRRRIRNEAAHWVTRLGPDADPAAEEEFGTWYWADPRHSDAYHRIAAIWSNAGRLPAAGAAQIQEPRRRMAYALAASFAAAIAVMAWLVLAAAWRPGASGEAAQLFATAIGEIRSVDLPDGSRLVLDTDSQVALRFAAGERRLDLRRGRARFIVAAENRPFIVSASAREVVATGTVFDVSLAGGALAVLLIEGSVEIRESPSREEATGQRLRPGQKLLLAGPAPALPVPASRGETMWPQRMLVFDGTRLEEAAALVNRYGGPRLKLGSRRIADLRVSGAYRAGDVSGFARSLGLALDLRLRTQADGSLLLDEAAQPAP